MAKAMPYRIDGDCRYLSPRAGPAAAIAPASAAHGRDGAGPR